MENLSYLYELTNLTQSPGKWGRNSERNCRAKQVIIEQNNSQEIKKRPRPKDEFLDAL